MANLFPDLVPEAHPVPQRLPSGPTFSGGGMGAFGEALAAQQKPGEPLLSGLTAEGMQEKLQHPVVRTALTGALAATAGPAATALKVPLTIMEPIAGATAEALMQRLTSERDPMQVLLGGGAPIALRGLFRVGRGAARQIGKRLPGAAAGLHEEAIEQGHQLVARLRPKDLDSLRAAAKSMDSLEVPLNNFARAVGEMGTDVAGLAKSLQPKSAMRIVKEVADLTREAPELMGSMGKIKVLVRSLHDALGSKALPLRQVRDNLEEIGAELGRLRQAASGRTGLIRGITRQQNILNKAYATILDDLDALPDTAPRILKEYRTALRNNFAVDQFEQALVQATDERATDALKYIKPRTLRQAWYKAKDSAFFRDSFTPAQQREITSYIKEVTKLPALPRPRGVAAGSALALTRTAGAGGIVTGVTGDPTLGAMAAGVAAITPRMIARAMMSSLGRGALREILSSRGLVSPAMLEALAVVARVGVTSMGLDQYLEATNQMLMQRSQPPQLSNP